MFRFRWLTAFVAIAAALVLLTADAHARAGGGFSSGSRGMRTFSSPPSTPTAPTAAPIQRSMTQPSTAAPFGQADTQSWLFRRPGLFGGLAAGFLGAGLFGLLFGQGLFGGMGGLRLDLRSAVANRADRDRRPADLRLVAAAQYVGACICGGASGVGSQLWQSRRNVGRHQCATGRANLLPSRSRTTTRSNDCSATSRLPIPTEDLSALRAKVTPEMLSYFSEQLAGNASRGLINRVTDVKLLQGDLAEAWREGDTDYATVAMKFALKDSMVERASGRTVEGGERSEVTELWTFMRARGGNWLLSAIQQT